MARTDRPDRHGFLLYGKAEDGLCGLAAMPDVARGPLRRFLTDRKAAPVFAIGPREKLASSSCVRPFRPLLHEAATGAALARILLWSSNLQPHPPPLHICALTAEDIPIEHSSMQQARTVAATGTALPFPLWRRESGLLAPQ